MSVTHITAPIATGYTLRGPDGTIIPISETLFNHFKNFMLAAARPSGHVKIAFRSGKICEVESYVKQA